MKKFIGKVCLFFLIIVIIDTLFGFSMDAITKRIDIGGTGRDNYICNKLTDDILVFGSSRAVHHYNAQMLTDSLGKTCYNVGEDGCGIIFAYGRLLMLTERYTPKTIIYEVSPSFDYLYEENKHSYPYRLKQHYDRQGIDSILWDIDPTERFKMPSGMYRHNSSFLQNMIVYFLKMSTPNGVRGFQPINQEMDTMKIKKDKILCDTINGYEYDSLKIKYLNKFMEKTKDMDMVFVVSPIWYGQDTLVMEPIKRICEKGNVSLIDFSNSPKYVHCNKYFKDGTHLNARGADEFTRDLIKELKKRDLK